MAAGRFPKHDVLTPSGQLKIPDLSDAVSRVGAQGVLDGFPAVEFLWRHWVPKGKVIILAGAGGAGKSSVLTGFAVARALGLPRYLGIAITHGATLIVTGEDKPIDYGRRMASWLDFFCEGKQTREQAAQVNDRITFLNLVGADLHLTERVQRDYFADEKAARAIAERAVTLIPRPDLIVIETVSRFGGDESNQAHAALIAACEIIAEVTSAAVILVSHTGKAPARENTFDAYASRGGSALADNARGTIVFGRMPLDSKVQRGLIGRGALPEERKHFVLALARSTFSPPQDPLILRPRSVRDSLVLEEADPMTAAEAAVVRNRRNAALAYAVGELIKTTKTATLSKLKANLGLLGGAVPYREIPDSIEDAIEDGVLDYSQKGERGNRSLVLGQTKPRPQNGAVEKESFAITIPFGEGIKEIG